MSTNPRGSVAAGHVRQVEGSGTANWKPPSALQDEWLPFVAARVLSIRLS
jgi:hypothetical protein